MDGFSSNDKVDSLDIFSTDENFSVLQIKTKMDEIVDLIKMLPLEEKSIVKRFVTEKVHEIFLALGSETNTTRSSEKIHLLKPETYITEPSSQNTQDKSKDTAVTDITEMTVFSPCTIDSAIETSKSCNISLSADSTVTSELSPNQYLIQSIGDLGDPGITHGNLDDRKVNEVNQDVDVPVTHEDPVGVDDDLEENDETTQQLMDEIDDIKPKSNIPFVKDGTPDTTCTTTSEDVSSLLSFLPQLSPYIKFDTRDGNLGEKEGYIHLTVERADGSVQNLKIAATTATPDECAQFENDKKLNSNCGDKQLTCIQKDLMDKETDETSDKNPLKQAPKFGPQLAPPDDITAQSKSAGSKRPKGRPRKQEVFHSEIQEDGQKVFVCPVCYSSTKTQYAMQVHMRRHSGEKPFSCDVCGKSFTTKGNLKNHAIAHQDDKPWKCTYCNKKFKEKKVMIIHERTHTGEKPYKCTVCDRAFSQSGVLKEHLLLHSGQKPHLCDLCGQEFRGQSSLRAHKLRHLQKKDFKCDQCDKGFICKADLTRHMITHTGVRPFMCSLCPKNFTRLNYLKDHINIHYGNKPFTCKECNTTFTDSISLHKHKKKHKIEKEEARKQANKSELQKQLLFENQSTKLPTTTTTLPGLEIMQPTQFGDQSFQVVLDENTTMEDLQKLQSLLSSASNADVNTVQESLQTAQPVYQVMCMNPNTQEIVEQNRTEQVVVEGQSAYLSAINMLANATSQQYSFSIQ